MRTFVYGTLKRGRGNHAVVADLVAGVEPATVPGFTLLDLGAFPAAIPCEGGWVRGEVLAFRDGDAERALGRLDRLEGHPTLYRREVVETTDGEAVWTYIWQGDEARGEWIGPEWPKNGDK